MEAGGRPRSAKEVKNGDANKREDQTPRPVRVGTSRQEPGAPLVTLAFMSIEENGSY